LLVVHAVAEHERIAQHVYLPRGRCRRVSGESCSIALDRDDAVEMLGNIVVQAGIAKDVAARFGAVALLGVFAEEVLRDAGHSPVGGGIRGASGEQPIEAPAQHQHRCGHGGPGGQAGNLVPVGEEEKCRRHQLRRREDDERQDRVEGDLPGDAHEGTPARFFISASFRTARILVILLLPIPTIQPFGGRQNPLAMHLGRTAGPWEC
jgi:hypothetical protein